MRQRFTQPIGFILGAQLLGVIVSSAVLFYLLVPCESFGATGLTLTTTFDNSYVNSHHPEDRYLEVLVQASERHRRRDHRRSPLNIALVLDRSGSMAEEDKLGSAVDAVWAVVQKLRPEDRFSLVTYNGHVEVPIVAGSRHNRRKIKRLLDNIMARGSTNLASGLFEGYRQVQQYYSSHHINRVMLFSDGQITEGMRSPRRLNQRVMDYAREGISLTTFGMGYDFNENLMASLSESGRGNYYYIDHSSSIREMLAQEFRSAETLVAQNIRVDITIDRRLHIGEIFANKFEIHGQTITLYGGDLAAGERRRFQIRLRSRSCHPGTYNIAKVHMVYTPVGQDRQVSERQHVNLHYQEKGHFGRFQNKGVSERTSIFKAHYARSQAAEAVDRGEMAAAKNILAKAKKDLQKSGLKTQKLREQKREVEAYATSLHKKIGRKDRARIQKAVKYDRHVLEGC